MTEQPTALRLADDLAKYLGGNTATQAAAELRRLSAENDRLESERDEARRTVREAHEAGTRLTAQRDALLESLKEAVDVCGWPNVAFFHKALAAIKAVEENT